MRYGRSAKGDASGLGANATNLRTNRTFLQKLEPVRRARAGKAGVCPTRRPEVWTSGALSVNVSKSLCARDTRLAVQERMMAKATRKNPVVLRPGLSIGGIAAETDDEFLFECFLYHPAYAAVSKISSPSMLLAGRTGSGKTAIIRVLEREAEYVSVVYPSEMALEYVSNSDALRFLQTIGADLDLFFQALGSMLYASNL